MATDTVKGGSPMICEACWERAGGTYEAYLVMVENVDRYAEERRGRYPEWHYGGRGCALPLRIDFNDPGFQQPGDSMSGHVLRRTA